MSDRQPSAEIGRDRVPGQRRRGPVCEYCGEAVRADQWHRALVPDSSVIHPEDPSFDGKREVHACGPAHLDELIQRARKQWSDEQLWFGRLARASTMPGMRVVSLRRVGDRARLTEEALDRALAWNARRADPDTTLPGGQRLPTTRPESN